MNEYKAKIEGRGRLKLYKDDIPKFFCVLKIEGVGEKKSMITVPDFFIKDPISKISKGDTVSFTSSKPITDLEWLNLDSSEMKIVDDSGTKEWEKQKELYIKEKRKEREAELKPLREQRQKEREEKIKRRKEQYKKYQHWYLEGYKLKTTGANVLLMYRTLNNIKESYSLIGKRGIKALLNDGAWERPTGLHASVFHGSNSNIVNKALNELTENNFAKIRICKVIVTDPYTKLKSPTRQKGLEITEKGLKFLSEFEKVF